MENIMQQRNNKSCTLVAILNGDRDWNEIDYSEWRKKYSDRLIEFN